MEKCRDWTTEEDCYIRNHWKCQNDAEMAAALNRSETATSARRKELHCSKQRPWTQEETEYLQEKWGAVSVPDIAKNLNRTNCAIVVRAQRLGLGALLEAGDYVTLNQVLLALTNGAKTYRYKMQSWVKNRGLPVHTKRVNKCVWRVVYLEEFWTWAEQHRSFIDFSKMEPLALGKEPAWVADQRRKDYRAFSLQRKDPWTSAEDDRLKRLLQQHKYGYAELAEILNRSEGAIARRCRDLGLKERPVRADNHSKESTWSDADYQAIAEGIRHGDSYPLIGRAVGRSEKAVRGKVYFTYLTEDADKVRAMMQDGPWGFGAPEPTVRQGFSLSRTRTEVRRNLSILDALLRKRINDLGYDPYWQRFMCTNWNAINGCTAGCTDCDSCTEFRRIKPQYCARCGATFYECAENRFCMPCRKARRNQAARRWYRENAR